MQSLERISEQEDEPRLQFLVFQMGIQNFALEIHRVKEILRNKDVTPLPGSHDYMEGAIEVRGKIIPVFDLRKRLGIAGTIEPQYSRILLVTAARRIVGMIVDAVQRVVAVSPGDIQPPPEVPSGGSYAVAVVKSESGLLVIPDLDAIVMGHQVVRLDQALPGN
jgi:purine-binding chemotaxis protein CheW